MFGPLSPQIGPEIGIKPHWGAEQDRSKSETSLTDRIKPFITKQYQDMSITTQNYGKKVRDKYNNE